MGIRSAGVECSFLPGEFSHQPVRRVHPAQRFENSRRMYRHGAGFLVRVDVVEHERLEVAVKYDSD